jgi:hypothetical protein
VSAAGARRGEDERAHRVAGVPPARASASGSRRKAPQVGVLPSLEASDAVGEAEGARAA